MEEDCQITFQKCMFQVLEVFISGGSDANDRFVDIIFDVIVILVQLTIIIAIVSDSWGTAENKASQYYWFKLLMKKFLNVCHIVGKKVKGKKV